MRLVVSPSAHERRAVARSWLASQSSSSELLIVGASREAAVDLAREVTILRKASFGWQRQTLGGLATSLATPALAERELAKASGLALEALAARVVAELAERNELGRFQPVASFPGLARAISRTVGELRTAGLIPEALAATSPDLARIFAAYEAGLARELLADRATVLRLATLAALAGEGPSTGRPTLLADVHVASTLERDLLAALAGRSGDVLATVPAGDELSLGHLQRVLGAATTERVAPRGPGSLVRLQADLFGDVDREATPLDEGVVVLSAPGESRECVEIARLVHREAARGVPFDRIAILLRAPEQYRAHLEESLSRAGIPAHFARGTKLPDPAGRAFLALLSCAIEGLSARRFAEYLSLAQVPDLDADGAPPAAITDDERQVTTDPELAPEGAAAPKNEEPVASPMRAPRRWERLLVESAVIGGRDRWERRLRGLRNQLIKSKRELEAQGQPTERTVQALVELQALSAYALPLLVDLDDLAHDEEGRPRRALWGDFLDRLGAIATRALRRPERVLAVLSELHPMKTVGPVDLTEVRLVLARRLTEVIQPPTARPSGKVYVAPVEAARGLAFDVVFVPGLAEKLFPQKVVEDPILRDSERAPIGLKTQDDRVAEERLALRLAVGAARERVVISYPRVDMEQSRPRVPSFYGLEVLRAAEGTLPGFDELARRAEHRVSARIGWPAPRDASHAIDDAEYDLATLDDLLRLPEAETTGAAHYLLEHEHLARALRFRARRWRPEWKRADGLVDDAKDPMPEAARVALAKHSLAERSFSATALQNFAQCPYRFVLYTMHKLSAREEPEAIEEIDPLARGSLVHEVLFELFTGLSREGIFPLGEVGLPRARERLDEVLDRVAARYEDDLCPAIPRVWKDGIDVIRADLREMLRRAAEDGRWVPHRFELSFGLDDHGDRDERSQKEPVDLGIGLRLRGSIDLVERHVSGTLRATDYKTGKQRTKPGVVINGGQTLQPVLYALALEKMFPESRVDGGRLYYSTSAGGFSDVEIPLGPEARDAAKLLVTTLEEAVEKRFFPAAPDKDACQYCDYQGVCGPYEEQRSHKKKQDRLVTLKTLRKAP